MKKNKIKLLTSIIIAAAIILIGCIAIIVIGKKTIDEKKEQISELEYEIEANKQIVYVAKNDIKAGDVLEDGVNLMKQEIYTGLDSSYYMGDDMLGGIAVLDIKEQQPIHINMVSALSITQDTREYEVSVANLMVDQTENDYVDVRIMFPTGEDYLVLSKKPVKNLILQNSIFFSYLNEDEILRLSSATIDAYTISGTYIYTTRYVESSLQDAAVPNYLVKPETIDLINTDPNILEIATETLNQNARIALESRLKGLTEEQLKAIAEGHSLQDTAKQSVLLDIDYTAGNEGSVEALEETEEEDSEEETEAEEDGVTENFTPSDSSSDDLGVSEVTE